MNSAHVDEARTDRLRASVGRYYTEFLNGRNAASVEEVLTSDVAFYGPSSIDPVRDRRQVQDGMRRVTAAFPDLRYRVIRVVGEGDDVVGHWEMTGTHTGAPFRGLDPSGRAFTVHGVHVFHFSADDRADELWDVFNTGSLIAQLDAPETSL